MPESANLCLAGFLLLICRGGLVKRDADRGMPVAIAWKMRTGCCHGQFGAVQLRGPWRTIKQPRVLTQAAFHSCSCIGPMPSSCDRLEYFDWCAQLTLVSGMQHASLDRNPLRSLRSRLSTVLADVGNHGIMAAGGHYEHGQGHAPDKNGCMN